MVLGVQEMHNPQPTEAAGIKFDGEKSRYDLIDPLFEEGLADILTMGAAKYSPGNWKHVGDAEDRYYSALRRHLNSYKSGELFDSESGKSHLYHAACCLMFLAHFERNKEADQPVEG